MQALKNYLRDNISVSARIRIIRTILSLSGNWLPRPLYGKATYNQDGLVTAHNADFMRDPRFTEAYRTGEATGSWTFGDLHWRGHVICWAAEQASHLPGDFVECGVHRGGYALMAMHYINFAEQDRTFYLLDTYDGLVEHQINEDERQHGVTVGEYRDAYESVKATFAPYNNVKIIKGIVPDTLAEIDTEQIAFLSLDMNTKEPEIAAATYLWDRLVSGAVVVLDDYGWRKHYEQKVAFDAFAKERGLGVLALPTGQGIIIKP